MTAESLSMVRLTTTGEAGGVADTTGADDERNKQQQRQQLDASRSDSSWLSRRSDLLHLARQRLADLREEQRRISDAHLEAKVAQERVESDVVKWTLLRDKCKGALALFHDLESADSSVMDSVIGDASLATLQGRRDALDAEYDALLLETETIRANVLGDAEKELQRAHDALENATRQCSDVRRQRESLESTQERITFLQQLVDEHSKKKTNSLASRSHLQQSVQRLTEEAANAQREEECLLEEQMKYQALMMVDGEENPTMESTATTTITTGPTTPVLESSRKYARAHFGLADVEDQCRSLVVRKVQLKSERQFLAELEEERNRFADLQRIHKEVHSHLALLRSRIQERGLSMELEVLQGALASANCNIQQLAESCRGMPTLKEVKESCLPALQTQVETLCSELNKANSELFLLRGGGQEDNEEEDGRNDRDDGSAAHMDGQCANLERELAVLQAEQQRLEEGCAACHVEKFHLSKLLQAWSDEELPRHLLFLQALDDDLARARQRVDELHQRRIASRSLESEEKNLAVPQPIEEKEEEENEVVEIWDAHASTLRRLTIPHRARPVFLSPEFVHEAPQVCGIVAAVDTTTEKQNHFLVRGQREGNTNSRSSTSLADVVRLPFLLYRSLVDLVKGRPVVVPAGGGHSLFLDV